VKVVDLGGVKSHLLVCEVAELVELHQDLGLVHPCPFMDSVCPTIASTPFFPTAGTRRPEYKTDRSILLEKIATQAIPESSCLQREILSRPPVAAHIVP
jgi:hypothetical protein